MILISLLSGFGAESPLSSPLVRGQPTGSLWPLYLLLLLQAGDLTNMLFEVVDWCYSYISTQLHAR